VVEVADNTSVLELVQMTLRFRVELSCWSSEFPWMPLKMLAMHVVQMELVKIIIIHWTMLNRALSKTR